MACPLEIHYSLDIVATGVILLIGILNRSATKFNTLVVGIIKDSQEHVVVLLPLALLTGWVTFPKLFQGPPLLTGMKENRGNISKLVKEVIIPVKPFPGQLYMDLQPSSCPGIHVLEDIDGTAPHVLVYTSNCTFLCFLQMAKKQLKVREILPETATR